MKTPLTRFARHAYAWLFASLLLTLVAAPVLGVIESRANWHDTLLAVNLILAVLTVRSDRAFRPLAVLALVFVGLRLGAAFGTPGLLDWGDALWLALILYILVPMVRCVLRPGPVDSERIFAALDTYLLAGLAFATGHWLMDQVWPGSFGGAAAQGLSRNDAVYFSYVTLATLGYGDIVPVSPPARGFTVLEAVGGQLYIAVLIARLVSLAPTWRAQGDEVRAKTSRLLASGERVPQHPGTHGDPLSPCPEDRRMIDARHYEAKETLRDGRVITIRAIRPEDSRSVAGAFAKLERQTVYSRLFAHKERLSDEELRRFTAVDFTGEVALVATCATQDGDVIIAGGRYIVCDAAGRQAEVAFTVEEDYQGLGIAGRLLEHLVCIGRDRGIAELVAEVLPGNTAMLRVFARSGLPMTQSHADGTVHVSLTLA